MAELLPYTDDGDALLLPEPRPCFQCGNPTRRLDLDFEGPWCATAACWQSIVAAVTNT